MQSIMYEFPSLQCWPCLSATLVRNLQYKQSKRRSLAPRSSSQLNFQLGCVSVVQFIGNILQHSNARINMHNSILPEEHHTLFPVEEVDLHPTANRLDALHYSGPGRLCILHICGGRLVTPRGVCSINRPDGLPVWTPLDSIMIQSCIQHASRLD